MIKIRKDTIIKAGDELVSPNGQERWKVKEMVGQKVYVIHPSSQNQKVFYKNDLLINDWTLEVNNRGYW